MEGVAAPFARLARRWQGSPHYLKDDVLPDWGRAGPAMCQLHHWLSVYSAIGVRYPAVHLLPVLAKALAEFQIGFQLDSCEHHPLIDHKTQW